MKKYLLCVVISFICINVNAQVTLPYSQDFEGITFPPSGWQTFPIGSPVNWIRDTTASGYGISTACTSFDNYNTVSGSYYGIRLPSMNFTNVTLPYIRFDIAYAQRTASLTDIFGLWWSNNGSSNWQLLHNYSGAALATAPVNPNLFVPAPNEWQTKTFSLASLAGLPYVRLAIEDDCYHGNKIYFDNVIVFDSAATGINENSFDSHFYLYPDPFSSYINIFSIDQKKITKAELFNSMGKLLISIRENNSELKMEHLSGLSAGIYFIRIQLNDGKYFCRKLLKL